MTEWILPREHEREQYVLGSLVSYPERALEVLSQSRLRATDFVDPEHQRIFSVFAEQARNGGIDLALARTIIKPSESSSGDFTKDYLDDLGNKAATTLFVPDEAAKIIEASKKRYRIGGLETALEHARNGYTSEQIDNEVGATFDDWRREAVSDTPRFRTYSAAELDAATFEMTYLIDGVLVAGQPCAIGGAEKTLKTSLMIDLGIALASGGRFLGLFPVNKPCRFLMFSGESGMPTLQETARRICRRAGYVLGDPSSSISSRVSASGLLAFMPALSVHVFPRSAPN